VADVAGESVGDDQRRAHQIIARTSGEDAALEFGCRRDADGDERVVFDALLTSVAGGPELPMQVVHRSDGWKRRRRRYW